MTTVDVKINESEFLKADQLLKELDRKIRGKAIEESLSKASQIVVDEAKREVPQPGYEGDDPGKKPLRDTITFLIRDYPDGSFVAIIGPQYPAGAHGHLVSEGHEIWLPRPPYTKGADAVSTGRQSKPDPFLERAADNTSARQASVIVSTLRQAAESVK